MEVQEEYTNTLRSDIYFVRLLSVVIIMCMCVHLTNVYIVYLVNLYCSYGFCYRYVNYFLWSRASFCVNNRFFVVKRPCVSLLFLVHV